MLWIILAVVCCGVGIFGPMFVKDNQDENRDWIRWTVRGVPMVLSVMCILATSFTVVDADKVGHLKRVITGNELPAGRIIALPGEKGPQAEILGPGLNFRLFLNVFYDVEELEVTEIPAGKCGILVSKDGLPLKEGQYLANSWNESEVSRMLDARYFMGEDQDGPRGQKGPQLTVLKPGKYRLNRYLFDVKLVDAVKVATGQVAVVKSNVQEIENCDPIVIEGVDNLSVPLVPKGCVGVWNDPILPGTYYLNRMAYEITLIPTQVQTWAYKGGYQKRMIDLDVDQDGKITQKPRTEKIEVPEGVADSAIFCKAEGWTVPQELRILVQVRPEDAPFVVASVGGIQEAEDKIVSPAVRSVVRTVIGRAVKTSPEEAREISKLPEEELALRVGVKVLDLVERRGYLETEIEKELRPESYKAHITVKEVRLAEPVIPPELLVARLRAQLADQLVAAYKKEREAQTERKALKEAQAWADMQEQLVQAEIDVKKAEQQKLRLKAEGEGLKLRDIEKAQGQSALVAVLGEDRVMQLEMLQKTLDAAVNNPQIVKVPQVLVSGQGSSLEGAAAVLGSSNLVQGIKAVK